MKVISAIACAALFLGSIATQSAEASVPSPGQFVASECGFQLPPVNPGIDALNQVDLTKSVAVTKVCIGQIVGADGESGALAVSFEFADGQSMAYKVAQTADDLTLVLAGGSKSTFFLDSGSGEVFSMHVLRSPDNQIARASGRLGEVDYSTSPFVPVLILQ